MCTYLKTSTRIHLILVVRNDSLDVFSKRSWLILNWTLGTYFSEFWIGILSIPLKIMPLKMLSAKMAPILPRGRWDSVLSQHGRITSCRAEITTRRGKITFSSRYGDFLSRCGKIKQYFLMAPRPSVELIFHFWVHCNFSFYFDFSTIVCLEWRYLRSAKMIEAVPKYMYMRIGLISVAICMVFVLIYVYLPPWDLSSDGGIYAPKHMIDQSLWGDMRPEQKPKQNLSLSCDEPNEALRQYKAWERLVAERQNILQQRVSQKCKKNRHLIPNFSSEDYKLRWVVDRTHGVAFRATAKAGSTSWLYVMASALYGTPTSDVKWETIIYLRKYHRSMADLTKWDIKNMEDLKYALQPYKKFTFVRHPLSRLLSAYNHKMKVERHRRMYGDKIRKFSTNKTISYNNNVTFGNFVRYIISEKRKAKHFDIHWRPLTLLLQSCQFHYNFIGRYETIEDDSEYIFQHLFREPSLTLPKANMANMKNDTDKYAKSIQEYYNELTYQELAEIINVYKDDFAVFGYNKTVPVR